MAWALAAANSTQQRGVSCKRGEEQGLGGGGGGNGGQGKKWGGGGGGGGE